MRCPFCAEEIQDAAIKCRYCGEFLLDASAPMDDTEARKITPISLSVPMGLPAIDPDKEEAFTGHHYAAIFLTIFCFPVGLPWLWLSKRFGKKFRVGVTIVWGICLLTGIFIPVIILPKKHIGISALSKSNDTLSSGPSKAINLTPEQAAKRFQPINISYDQLMNKLDQYFTMKKESPVWGYDFYTGKSSDGYALINITGSKHNISEASLIFIVPIKKTAKIDILNTLYLLRFVRNACPELTDDESDTWVNKALDELKTKSGPSERIVGEKKISISKLDFTRTIFCKIDHK